jgi:hypothetical protein
MALDLPYMVAQGGKKMKTRMMALLLVGAGALLAETHVSIGVHVGARPSYVYVPAGPPPVAVVARPACPGPGYVWVDGYRDGYGAWFDGYWAMPPYVGAYWVAPRWAGHQFHPGYWGGTRRVVVREEYRYRPSGREFHGNRGRDDFDRGRGRDRSDRGRGNGRGRR